MAKSEAMSACLPSRLSLTATPTWAAWSIGTSFAPGNKSRRRKDRARAMRVGLRSQQLKQAHLQSINQSINQHYHPSSFHLPSPITRVLWASAMSEEARTNSTTYSSSLPFLLRFHLSLHPAIHSSFLPCLLFFNFHTISYRKSSLCFSNEWGSAH